MASPTPVPNTTHSSRAPQGAAPHTTGQLPFVHEGSPEFKALLSNPAAQQAYRAQLHSSINAIRQFINHHATSNGRVATQRTLRVLAKLDDYLRERVNCAPCDLKAIMLNQHRTDLLDFAQSLETLSNPEEVSKGLSCAVEMAEGLGVCAEGEYLNIHEQLIALKCNSTGLEKHIQIAKETLINQNLLALVRSEAADFMGVGQARALEIHQVQTLRNALSQKWGLEDIQDKHAHALYAQQAGQMADELLEQTITPASMAHFVAEEVRSLISNFVGSHDSNGTKLESTANMANEHIHTLANENGIPLNSLTDNLGQGVIGLLQAEFGLGNIDLHDFLDATDSAVRLKPAHDIAKCILKADPAKFGLVCPAEELDETVFALMDAHLETHEGPGKVSIEQRLTQLKTKRNSTAAAALWGLGNSGQRWINQFSGVLEGTIHQHELKDEEKKREQELAARHAAFSAAAHTRQPVQTQDNDRDDVSEVDPNENRP